MRVGSRCGVPQREKYSVELLFIVFKMHVWDLNDWQMMSSKTNRVMTKQAATGNNIGLVGDFRHGNNQLQTTENCYIETLRTSDNSDN